MPTTERERIESRPLTGACRRTCGARPRAAAPGSCCCRRSSGSATDDAHSSRDGRSCRCRRGWDAGWTTSSPGTARPSSAVVAGRLTGRAADGSTFEAARPFAKSYDGPADPAAFAASCTPPDRWGVLLVRKGGFAIARLRGEQIVESKVGQRHVQGRTKAGGQSQQRFSRRRDNQARAAYEAAAGHAERILTGPLTALVCGGDQDGGRAGARGPATPAPHRVRVDPWLAVPDPRRAVLEQAVADACSIAVEVTNA